MTVIKVCLQKAQTNGDTWGFSGEVSKQGLQIMAYLLTKESPSTANSEDNAPLSVRKGDRRKGKGCAPSQVEVK